MYVLLYLHRDSFLFLSFLPAPPSPILPHFCCLLSSTTIAKHECSSLFSIFYTLFFFLLFSPFSISPSSSLSFCTLFFSFTPTNIGKVEYSALFTCQVFLFLLIFLLLLPLLPLLQFFLHFLFYFLSFSLFYSNKVRMYVFPNLPASFLYSYYSCFSPIFSFSLFSLSFICFFFFCWQTNTKR